MVNYGIYLLTIVALVLLVSIVRHSAYMERKRNFQYDITALCVVVALASVVGRDYAGTHHIYWLAVVSSFLIDTASVVYFLFFIGSLRSWKSAVMIAFEIVGGVIVMMAIASPVTGWLYKISADGAFEKGDYQSIAALYLILGFIGLFECGVLVRHHGDDKLEKLMESWWKEFCSGIKRDQISLPPAIEKMKFSKYAIMEGNVFRNQFEMVMEHSSNS